MGATKTQALETKPLPGLLDGNRSRNDLFLAAHRLFQTNIKVFTPQRRTNRFCQIVDLSHNRGGHALPRTTCGRRCNLVDDGTGKLDLIFGSKPESQRTRTHKCSRSHTHENIPAHCSVKLEVEFSCASVLANFEIGSSFQSVIESWRDLVLAPGGARGEASPPAAAKVLNTLLALLLLIGAVWLSLLKLSYNWNWESVWDHRAELFMGWLMTLGVTAVALVLSTVGGFVLALFQRSFVLPLRYFAKVLVEIVRCTPLLVLILLFWYGFGGVFQIGNEYRYVAGILILTLFESTYISEIMRAGIESVGKTQIESARAIGFTRVQTYRYVIIPQAIRQVLPPLVGQLVSLIKDSSLLSYIAIQEFTFSAQQVNSNTYSTLETYLPLAVGYLVLTIPISLWSRWLERRFKYET